MTSRVIVLNGVSSSGKTTLALELQRQLSENYLRCSLDMFWNMTPPMVPASSVSFPKLKPAMAQCVRALVETGHNVIVDTIYSGEETQFEMNQALDGIKKVTVKVECDLRVLKQREKKRGDRKIGLAESQLETVHEGVCYDLTINTSGKSVVDSAQFLIDFVKTA
ncbi:chloramphenicol phosphotransferase CPT family protein [Kordiimonas aquimaris]|uniref:chloramphenicol phosphotransferase CPT family protein n=1 Tax=Kordiimonas aquimaris TaxID=707591 RepID=UPI0021D25F3E|nr:chloramphenicol phosphotransferase CPT family protein [Kordiimonas aquimaris]